MKIVDSKKYKRVIVSILFVLILSGVGLVLHGTAPTKESIQEQVPHRYVKELTEKGFVLFRQHQYLESINSFTKALQLTKEPYDLLLYRANVYLQLGENEKSLIDATKAIQIEPKNPHGYQFRASVFARNKQTRKGLKDLIQAIDLDPTLSENYLRRGDAYLILGEHQKALDDLSQAIYLGNKTHLVFRYRGYAYEQLGQYRQAIDDYSMALITTPGDNPSLIGRGWLYSCLGNSTKAIADFSEVLLNNPHHMDARLQRAITYSEIGELDSAEGDLIFGISQGTNHPEYYLYLADINYRRGKISKALDINKKLELLTNEHSLVPMYLQRGLFYFHQGQIIDSKKFYLKGIEQAEKHLDMVEVKDAILDLQASVAQYAKQPNVGQEILNELEAAKDRMALSWEPDVSSCSVIKAKNSG